MAYRYGNRDQQTLLPSSIEDYVPEDAPVRAYDAMIEALDLPAMGFVFDSHRVGNSQYNPKAMLKLLVYGYSYGLRSSRKLERECHYNLSFIWLVGGLKPDHKTIAEFRRRNKYSLRKVIHQCARICIDLNLIDGNVLFMDGTRLRANASIEHSWTSAKGQTMLAELDERISDLVDACEQADQNETEQSSLVHLEKTLADQRALKNRIEQILTSIEQDGQSSVNTTDPDCIRIHSRQGSHAGYTGQIAVDDAHGLIVNSDVVSQNNDSKQFANQLKQANAILTEPCKTGCADAGYTDYETLSHIDYDQTDVIVPSQTTPSKTASHPFDKSRFVYNETDDCYLCPAGHRLTGKGIDAKKHSRIYYAGSVCRSCKHFGHCTTNRLQGRKVRRYDFELLRMALEERYQEPDAQAIFARRKMRVEHPFGHIKRNLNAGHFLLRGLAGVRAEMSLLASCFNIRRLITLLGVPELIAKLQMR